MIDGFVDDRHYISPPSDTGVSDITMVDNETSARTSAKFDDKIGKTQIQAQAFVHYLARRSIHFSDFTLDSQTATEDLHAWRTGGNALVTRPFLRDWRWAAALSSIDRDHQPRTSRTTTASTTVKGDVTVVEPAADLQYEHGRFRIDAAGGAAVPIGVGADAWPEAKVVAKYRATQELELTATGARKGRVPTLRERFDPLVGNPDLKPENSWVGEVRGVYQHERLRLEVAPYIRYTTGSITNIVEADGGMRQENLGKLNVYGVDTSARVKVHPIVEVGGSFGYLHQHSDSMDPVLAEYPLNRLPTYRADGWVQAAPDRRISALVRARYFGQSVDQTGTIAAYTLLEASITAPITKEYLFVLRCRRSGKRRARNAHGLSHGGTRGLRHRFKGSGSRVSLAAMRLALALAAAVVLVGGCGDDSGKMKPFVDSGYNDAPPDGTPPYWEPVTGHVKYWDIQLTPPYDLSASRALYVLPLWALVPSPTMIDYGDGDPVAVPKGALAGQIEIQKARRPQPRIVCELGAGSVDLVGDPDARKFAGFEANPPDDPTPPKTGSVIGWSTTFPPLRPHRRWLDIRAGAARDAVLAIVAKRIALAKQIGCDGILPDDIHMYRVIQNNGTPPNKPYTGTGFATDTSPDDQFLDFTGESSYYEAIATAIHQETLSAGARGDWEHEAELFGRDFDWMVVDRCGEFMECDQIQQFVQTRKAILAIDYTTTTDGSPQNASTCGMQTASSILDGIIKDAALSSSSWYACADFGMSSGPSESDDAN